MYLQTGGPVAGEKHDSEGPKRGEGGGMCEQRVKTTDDKGGRVCWDPRLAGSGFQMTVFMLLSGV